jgi:hypothetical protein
MKTTRYFDEQVSRKRPYLLPEWFEDFHSRAVRRSVQDDGRIRYWVKVALVGEAQKRWLRIVCLDNDETIHNAFLDRDFKEQTP